MVIGIYTRKSVYRDNSDSIDVQEQICRDYARIIYSGQPLEFIVYNHDEGFSGGNTNRPGFKAMMEDVKANVLNVVMVYRLDRIARNVPEFASIFDIFQKHNVSFVSTKESFDTGTPIGRTVMYILAAFAQLERENVSERVTDSMLALGSSGKWTGGNLPPGMSSIRKTVGTKEHSYLIVNPDTISNIKMFYSLLLEGYSITKLERYLRDHGIRSESGKFLSTSQLHSIITNPVYCQNSLEAYDYFQELGCQLPDISLFDGTRGLIGYGRTRTSASSQPKQDASKWNIAVGIHEPVIPAADWIAAQRRLGVNKMYRAAKYEVGILKGILRCPCGSRIDIRTYKKNDVYFSYYYCAKMARQGKTVCNTDYVRVDKVDEAFLRELRKIRLNPAGIRLRKEASPALDIAAITAEIGKIDNSIANLTKALTQAMDSPAAGYIISQIGELDTQKKTLEGNLRQARRILSKNAALQESEKIVFDNICCLLDNFDKISYKGKNELIRKIVKTCTFDGESLRIVF